MQFGNAIGINIQGNSGGHIFYFDINRVLESRRDLQKSMENVKCNKRSVLYGAGFFLEVDSGKPGHKVAYRVVLLAKNNRGFHNILFLLKFAQRRAGIQSCPLLSLDVLEKFHDGTICLLSGKNCWAESEKVSVAPILLRKLWMIYGKKSFFIETYLDTKSFVSLSLIGSIIAWAKEYKISLLSYNNTLESSFSTIQKIRSFKVSDKVLSTLEGAVFVKRTSNADVKNLVQMCKVTLDSFEVENIIRNVYFENLLAAQNIGS